MPDARPTDPAAQLRLARTLGIVLIVGGVLLDTVGFLYEGVVAASGPVVIVAGLIGIIVVLVKDFPPSANIIGLLTVVLGVILLIHDLLFPPALGVPLHAATGIVMVVVGALHVAGRSNLLRLLGQKSASS